MLKSVTFEVAGEQQLHSECCEQRLKRLLKGLQGVAQVRAQAKNQQIEVLFDPAVLEPAAIIERLSSAGHETRITTRPSDSKN